MTCQTACRITLSGTVTVAGQRLKLPAVKSTLRKAGRRPVRVKLPARPGWRSPPSARSRSA